MTSLALIRKSAQNLSTKIRLKALTVMVLPFLFAANSGAQTTAVLSWSANPEADVTGYNVYLGTASGVYTVVQNVGNVTSYTFSGLSPDIMYYCAVQARNSTGLTGSLSAEIAFSRQSAAELLSSWAAAGGLTGAAALPSAEPFGDGVCNMLKFAFNMNAAGPDVRTLTAGGGVSGLPVFSMDQSASPAVFTVEYVQRKGSGLVYTPMSSVDLVNFQAMTETPEVTSIDGTWERVKIRRSVQIANSPRMFGSVQVTLP